MSTKRRWFPATRDTSSTFSLGSMTRGPQFTGRQPIHATRLASKGFVGAVSTHDRDPLERQVGTHPHEMRGRSQPSPRQELSRAGSAFETSIELPAGDVELFRKPRLGDVRIGEVGADETQTRPSNVFARRCFHTASCPPGRNGSRSTRESGHKSCDWRGTGDLLPVPRT